MKEVIEVFINFWFVQIIILKICGKIIIMDFGDFICFKPCSCAAREET